MARALIRRTWPCGMQESVDWHGLFLTPSEDELPRNCPQHGNGPCYKGVGSVPVM